MKASVVLRRAAKFVFYEPPQWTAGMCRAVWYSVGGNRASERIAYSYVDLFEPPRSGDEWWGMLWSDDGSPAGAHACRVLALCLAAAIAESEGN